MKRLACTIVAGLSLSGCATWPRTLGSTPCCITGKPLIGRQPIAWHLVDVTVVSPVERSLHVVRQSRRVVGIPARSFNLKDGVLTTSTFFTPRDIPSLTPEAVRWGPTDPRQLPTAPFTITKPKLEGKTPGFFVTDARGRRYLLKLDPIEAPELLSGAEVVTSKLIHALGYHVPSYEILRLEPGELRFDPMPSSHARLTTQTHLDELIRPRLKNGRLRVVASRLLDGEILGPAKFKAFRDCTEMRALKLAYAWVNDIDTKDHNSLLVWDGTRTVGYLIDFGTSLGADAGLAGPKSPCAGWRYVVDMDEWWREVVTLGLHRSRCHRDVHSFSPAVGTFSGQFDPKEWKPYAPNIAFHEMNEDDAEWIAGRMAQFSRAHIQAAVEAGQYSRPEDAAYLVETLDQRRLAIMEEYLESEEEDDDEKARRAHRVTVP